MTETSTRPPDSEKERARKLAWSRSVTSNRRDVAHRQKYCLDEQRRAACKFDLALHARTYHANKFGVEWAECHFELAACIQRAILESSSELFLLPRGSGKTSWCRVGVEWGALHGHLVFAMIFGAEDSKAKQHIKGIKHELLTNDLLDEDFGEITGFIRASDGIANRANYQTCEGVSTEMIWGGDHIILPTAWGSEKEGNAGVIIGVGTITGSAARGPLIKGVRPDLALIDDAQTRKSAKSGLQVAERSDIINGDILGMAGPQKTLSVLMTGTVIYKNDLAEKFYDDWGGIRVSMIEEWPTNRDLWDKWNDLRKQCIEDGHKTLAAAHEFYVANKDEMDDGHKVYWPSRIAEGYDSAIETAMGLYYRDPATFMSEFQNEPLDQYDNDSGMPLLDELMTRENGYDRWEIPDWATIVVAFIDVQSNVLFYEVKAFADEFTGAVIDYGTWPDQQRRYYTKSDLRNTLQRAAPTAAYEGALYKGLTELIDMLEQRPYVRNDGSKFTISPGIVDARYGNSTDVVYKVLDEQRKRGRNWMPAFGTGVKATQQRISAKPTKPGDKVGPEWKIPRLDLKKRPIQHVTYDANYWKTHNAQRWSTPVPEDGHQTIFKGGHHRVFFDGLLAEYGILVKTETRTAMEWFAKPNIDNEPWDMDTGCSVAASIAGISMKSVQSTKSFERSRPKITSEFVEGIR